MRECISSDSSFYICFLNELEREDWLFDFLDSYSFYMGERINSEVFEKNPKNEMLKVKVEDLGEFNYYELIRPYFGRSIDKMKDGEYEAIGIAHFLKDWGILSYLILDDLRPRKFVLRHFPQLQDNLVGTIGFIRDCCCLDKKISQKRAIEILNSIKKSLELGYKERPCGMDTKSYKSILIPVISKIDRGCDGE